MNKFFIILTSVFFALSVAGIMANPYDLMSYLSAGINGFALYLWLK